MAVVRLLFLLFLPVCAQATLPNAEIHIESDEEGALLFATFASFGSRGPVRGRVKLPPSNVDPLLCAYNETFVDTVVEPTTDTILLLVPRGNCSFEQKAWNAQQLGASGVIIYNTLESRYGLDKNDSSVVYPKPKLDYECDNGISTISNLELDPPAYNGSHHDQFLTLDSDENICLLEQDESKCESRRCLVTGPSNSSNGDFEACCAWDVTMTMGSDRNFTDGTVAIPTVFCTMRQADQLLPLADSNTTLYIQERPSSVFNVSSLLLWGMAICIVTFASWYSVRDYRKCQHEWEELFRESVARHMQQQQQRRQQQQQSNLPVRVQTSGQEENVVNNVDEESQEQHQETSTINFSSDESPDLENGNATEEQQQQQEAAESSVDSENSIESPPDGRQEPRQPQQQQVALELNAWHAAGFVIVASSVLLILFYFEIYSWVTILYGIGCSGATSQLLICPLYVRIVGHVKCLQKCCFANITTKSFYCELNTVQWVNICAAFTGYTIGAMWLYVGFTDPNPSLNTFYWVTQDVFGAVLSILFLSLLRLSSIKVATILLLAVFIYDIFFVFITPYLFQGESVMVSVATGGGGPEESADFCAKYPDDEKCQGGNPLPLLLTIPRINDYRGGSALLGLGDIVLPGLLLAFAARLDSARRLVGSLTNNSIEHVPKRWYNGYLFPLVIAYAIGLLAANVAVVLMERGQPALLYIVPACLGTVFVVGRKEMGELWRGPQVIPRAERIVGLGAPSASLVRLTPVSVDDQDESIAQQTEGEQQGEATTAATTRSGSVRSIS